MALAAAAVLLEAVLLCSSLACAFGFPPPAQLPPDTAAALSTPFPPESSEAKPAFHVELGSNVTLREPQLKLKEFTGLKPGHFSRGNPSFNTLKGIFTAPQSGIYLFTAQVHFLRDNLQRTNIDLESYVTVAICISDDCQEKASLESSSSISSQRFSTVATGLLDLVAGETVSAVVHSSSASEHTMVINEKTSFMGHYVQD